MGTLILFTLLFLIRGRNGDDELQYCPNLSTPLHGYFLSGSCERVPHAFCGVACLPGYRLTDGDTFRECLSDGTWTGQDITCEEIHCIPLKNNSHLMHECEPQANTWIVGTKCRARCLESGYRLIGPEWRECLIVGQWTGYDQLCIVNTETTAMIPLKINSTSLVTTIEKTYQDYSNYLLRIYPNDSGLLISPFQSPQMTILFWFYLENRNESHLMTFQSDQHYLRISVINRRLAIFDSFRNATEISPIEIPLLKWSHIAWTYSNITRRSYLYVDGLRQWSMKFYPLNFNLKNLLLFNQTFDGFITRMELWDEMISEQQLLGSYRDCRKQSGNVFSWSQVTDHTMVKKKNLRNSSFCSGCSQPATIDGGMFRVSDYTIGATVDYACQYGYELIGTSRAVCMVSSEWYPPPPICRYNPCNTDCDQCDRQKGICLRRRATTPFPLICVPSCEDDETCIDGECAWTNFDVPSSDTQCSPSCPSGTECIERRCQAMTNSSCSASCRSGQVCIEGQCGCSKGLCDGDRLCYEICQSGEQCFNQSCSCGQRGKCGRGEVCQSDLCRCGNLPGGCQSNELCLNGQCICQNHCEQIFCPFPCLHGGRCSGFYRCNCPSGWQGHRCQERTIEIVLP